MTVYKPRSAWTSSSRGGAHLTGSKLVGIAWHWPGTSQDEIGVESEAATANRLRGYRNFHVGTRGWSDIGYNMAIDQAGRVWDLRGLGRVGAHCASVSNPDANHEWMGVLLILGDRERPSARMIRACQDFVHDVFLPRWPGRSRDTGHGRAPGVPGAQTSCPGPFAAELIVDDVLTAEPDQEDDMPLTNDEKRDIAKLSADAVIDRLTHTVGKDEAVVTMGQFEPGFTAYPNKALEYSWAYSKGVWRLLRNQVLPQLAKLRAAQGDDPVDVTALASELAPLVIPPVVAALSDEDGATPEQVEERVEQALKDFFAPLTDA